jgi:uncharacterized LabA/DUF88 family protein
VWILVDYANLDPMEKQRGLEHVVWRLLQGLGQTNFEDTELVRVRLYGGWYQGDALSTLAQQLSAEIAGAFPKPMELLADGKRLRLRVIVELARSLLVDPARDLFHTFRPRGLPGGLRCATPPFEGCANVHACPIRPLHELLEFRICPTGGCEVRAKDVLDRAEQKLVDTMITTDLVQLALEGERLAIVSSDDDMWPGIRMALSRGHTVLHLHPKRGQFTPKHYKEPTPEHYVELSLFAD